MKTLQFSWDKQKALTILKNMVSLSKKLKVFLKMSLLDLFQIQIIAMMKRDLSYLEQVKFSIF